ncbi:Lipopolysaccharide export system protein LptC [compost metagenome]|uniref:Lipopolysaccharide export system protein LptC n=1 Tax=Pseudomonas jinjuensis TaxID=198616 RepID=A0A1H0QLX8_9PSED|nr:LPS export ABC transporter periplasmic protein LptC [Pseudomonas jinjuensis]SDP18391.1 lipopolysaccharide export system protein LptC [Pseudomonas jinjuensis]
MPKTLRQKLLLILIAVLLIALGYYWNVRLDLFSEGQPRPQPSEAIDYYAMNAHSIQYRADGSLEYEMTAEKLEHQKATDITDVTTPDLYIYRDEPQPWHVQSVRAEVAPGGKQVELIDDVRVARTDAKGRSLLLTTTRLTVFPDDDLAQTEQPVRIEEPSGVTTAKGMKAYLKDSRMLLLSNVRGQHEAR